MVLRAETGSASSPRVGVGVGEIDTRAPFQSVRAAVSLFGVGAASGDQAAVKKTKPLLQERILAKESRLHFAEKELNKFKEQLKNAETMKAQALAELERAKRTVNDLRLKLKTINESKEAALMATETAKDHAKKLETAITGISAQNNGSWKHDLDNAREECASVISELDTAKQELWKIRHDFEASINAKITAFQQAADASHAVEVNKDRAAKISKEIASIQESLTHLKLASEQAQLEESNAIAKSGAQQQTVSVALEETWKNLESLKEEFNSEMTKDVEKKLAETVRSIDILQKEIEDAKISEMNKVRIVTIELDGAKDTLNRVAEEGSYLRNLVDSLKQELEGMKKEHSELKAKEMEAESVTGNLHVKLRKIKTELEEAFAGESQARSSSNELMATLQQLLTESANARKEAEALKRNAEELRKEAETARIASEEAEKKLQEALKEAEEAKAAEAIALDQLKILSEKRDTSNASAAEESETQITVSVEEYNALNQKVGESNKLADMKVAAVMAEVEAVRASENEALKRLEAMRKEIEDIDASTEEALKRAEMAEAAKLAVEGELQRWHERDQKKAAETVSRAEVSTEVSPPKSRFSMSPSRNLISKSPSVSKSPSRNSDTEEGEKAHKRGALLPSFSGMFTRRKSQHLVDDKPV